MDKRNTGLIATITTALLCGCCSLFACIMGFGAITGNGTIDLGQTTQPMPPAYGYVFLCLSLLFILVPVVVGFATLRKKPVVPAPGTYEPIDNEPLPPAS